MLKHSSSTTSRQANTSSVVGEHLQNPYYTMESPTCHNPAKDWKRMVPKLLIGGGCVLLALVLAALTWKLVSGDRATEAGGNAEGGDGSDHVVAGAFGLSGVQPHITRNVEYTKEERDVYFGQYRNDSDFSDRLLYQGTFDDETFKKEDDPKVIVILSRLDDKDIGRCSNKPPDIQQQRCDFTFNRSRIVEADAVVVREGDLYDDNVLKRSNDKQVWIYNTLIPNLIKKPIQDDIKKMFNLTGTFDRRSYLPILPMYWKRDSSRKNISGIYRNRNFTKDVENGAPVRVVVYNQNCDEEDKFRQKYASKIGQLEESGEVVVEWYGSCSSNTRNWKPDCINMSSAQCYEQISTKSKFALAFELVDVKDYISERYFNPLQNTILPLVLNSNSSKYDFIEPKGSFLDVPGEGMNEFINVLKTLNKDDNELKRHFPWLVQNSKKGGEFKPYLRWYCQVCATLYRAVNVTSSVPDIDQWR
uniref:Fucosyltransferase n=1 Tax=Graphocephala atropunctata TaxID=36148 RepID=A0A1B6L798_9HEMI